MPTDLCVVVGEKHPKEYHYHAAVLACQSTFIDAALAAPMKERSEHVIHLVDLEPATWEAMIKFLSPAASRRMTIQDVQQVAAAYDQYDFVEGRQVCDSVVAQVFNSMLRRLRKPDN